MAVICQHAPKHKCMVFETWLSGEEIYVAVDDDRWHAFDDLYIFLTQSVDQQETISTQQNSYSISHLLGDYRIDQLCCHHAGRQLTVVTTLSLSSHCVVTVPSK